MRLLLFCLVLGLAPGTQVLAQPAFGVAVWLQGGDDSTLKARIAGQTADLAVELLPVERDGRLLSPRERLAVAGELLQKVGARALLYWEPSPRGGRRLRVLSGERVFSRELGGEAAQEPARSATLESAAVVVRTVLRTLLAGEPTGVSLSEALATEPEAAAAPEAAPAPITAEPERAPDPPPRAAWRPGFVMTLGWQVAVDGRSVAGQHALSLSLGITVSRLLVRLWLIGGLPAGLDDGQSLVALSRHGLALGVLAAVVQRPRLRLVAGVLAGLCGYYRTTEAVSAGYEAAAPSFVPALCLGPQLELWLRFGQKLPLYFALMAGAELGLGRPRLGYTDAGAFVPSGTLWPLQPTLGLSLLYLWERGLPVTAGAAIRR